MRELATRGPEVWPVLPPVHRKIGIVNREHDGREVVHIKPPMGAMHPLKDCSAISETIHASIRNASSFWKLSISERQKLIADNDFLSVYRTLTSPDLMFAAKVTQESSFLDTPAGYVATRFNLHRFPRPSWDDHSVVELVSLHVIPELQGRNLGHELLSSAEEQAKELGIATMVAEVPEPAVSWLVHEGFTSVGRIEDQHLFPEDSHVPLVYMEKPLGLPQGLSPAVNMPHETYAKIGIAGMAALQFQYDLPVSEWRGHGGEMDPNRQLFLKYLQPFIEGSLGEEVLDIGGGLGWLSDQVLSYGGNPLCLEPSKRNVKEGRKAHPEVEFVNSTLQAFKNNKRFDKIYTVMVDNFIDLDSALRKEKHLLSPRGKYITIISDYDRTVQGRPEYHVETERIVGATAVHIQYPGKYGDLWAIVRTVDSYIHRASLAGLHLQAHTPIFAEPGHPHFGKIQGPLFHMLEFTAVDS